MHRPSSTWRLSLILAASALTLAACNQDKDDPSVAAGGSDAASDDDAAGGSDAASDDDAAGGSDAASDDDAAGGSDSASDDDAGAAPMMPATAEPSKAAARVLEDIADYSSWSKFYENPEIMESAGHAPGGTPLFVLTYRNDIVAQAEVAGTLPLPDGSLIVKENYPAADAAMPAALTVMAKVDNSWFWLQSTPDGKIMLDPEGNPREGDVPGCIGCHSDNESNDFVFLHDFSEPAPEGTVPPSEDTRSVLDSIEGYGEWSTFSENSELMESSGHAPGGNALFVLTYRNSVVEQAEKDGTLPLPDGSLLVKENYPSADAESPAALTIMAKREGEWYWAQTTPEGRVLSDPEGNPVEGTDVAMCKNCHMMVEDNDFVFLHDFSQPLDSSAN